MDLFYTFVLLLTISLLNLGIGFLVFTKIPRNRVHQLFLGVCLSFVAWGIAVAVMSMTKSAFAAKFTFAAGTGIGYFSLLLAWYFPKRINISLWTKCIVSAVALVFFAVSFTDLIDISYQPLVLGPLFPVYTIFLGIYLIVGITTMLLQYKTLDLIGRRQVAFYIVGFFLTVTLGFICDLVFPLYGVSEYIKFGPVSPVFFIVFTSVAIMRYKLMEIKILATELFVSALVLFYFFNIFSNLQFSKILLSTGIFAATVFFGISLVRSVRKEVAQREEIESLAARLTIANKQLKALDRSKSEFISMASHQLRTPLAVIKGYLSMAEEGVYGKLKDNLSDVLKRIAKSNQELIVIVSHLLDVSRIEQGRIEVNAKIFDINDLVRGCVEFIRPRAKEKGLKIAFNPLAKGVRINSDEHKVHEIVMNFLDNSVKYTDRGGIIVSIEKDQNNIRVLVKDTGRGIEKENIKKVFDKFTVASSAKSRAIGGLGIGLYICKRFSEMLGGRVYAISDGKGKGSVFIFELPKQIKKY